MHYEELLVASGFRRTTEYTASAPADPLLCNWHRSSRPPADDDASHDLALHHCLSAAKNWDTAFELGDTSTIARRRTFGLNCLDHANSNLDTELFDSLRQLWNGYLERGRARLAEFGGPVLVGPELVGGFGRPDLVTGHTLIEIKTGQDANDKLPEWFDQALGYLLLDTWNALRISTVAIYLGREALTLTCSLNELMRFCTSPNISITQLRQQFRKDQRDQLDDHERKRTNARLNR